MPTVVAICSAGAGSDVQSLLPVLAPALIAAILFVVGHAALPTEAGSRWRAAAFLFGLLALTAALVPPMSLWSEQLFYAHMIEHEIVLAVAAPLLVVSQPGRAMLAGVPRPLQQVFRWAPMTRLRPLARSPGWAAAVHGGTIWLMHAPLIFDATIGRPLIHHLVHLAFLVTAIVFWRAIFRANQGAAAGYLFLTMLHTSVLGALITLSPRILYPLQTAQAPIWGFSPLEDQQLAGLLMWIPAGIAYAALALYLVARWIREAGEDTWSASV